MRTRPDAHTMQFWKCKRGTSQPAIAGKQKSERSKIEQIWEPDVSQEIKCVRGTKGSGERRGSGG